jgi:translation elongation factor EF-Tu-like GTPase
MAKEKFERTKPHVNIGTEDEAACQHRYDRSCGSW